MSQQQGEWREPSGDMYSQWRKIFNSEEGNSELQSQCPVCSAQTLHRWYVLEHQDSKVLRGRNYLGRGRLWEWCSSCRTFGYLPDGYVPDWWVSPYHVEPSSLQYDPGPIEEMRASVSGG